MTLEITSGQVYRGKLLEGSSSILSPCLVEGKSRKAATTSIISTILTSSTAEDNMNVQLKDITVTARDGRVSHLDQVYIRGSHVRFFIVPDMLRSVLPLLLSL